MTTSLMSPLMWQSTPFGDQDAWQDFLGVHAAWHVELAKATGTRYVLIDDLRYDSGGHDSMHEEVGRVLGQPASEQIGGFDLNEESGYQSFMFLHSAEHQRFREAAGL